MRRSRLHHEGRLAGLLILLVSIALVLSATVLAQDAQMIGSGELLPRVPDGLDLWLHWTVRGVEVTGIAVIVFGAIAASIYLVWQFIRHEPPPAAAYHSYRANLARAILLGLEFLVAADIINTVAFEPTLHSLAILAGIVLIRTFLSFSLEVEIEGRWPWQHGARADKAEARRLVQDNS
jgi:uncharacterized membrane protein